MQDAEQANFNDFFDTPPNDFSKQEINERVDQLNPVLNAKIQEVEEDQIQNESCTHLADKTKTKRKNVSLSARSSNTSVDYSSDSAAESDSKFQNQRPRKSRSRSHSASPRSDQNSDSDRSYTSTDSRSSTTTRSASSLSRQRSDGKECSTVTPISELEDTKRLKSKRCDSDTSNASADTYAESEISERSSSTSPSQAREAKAKNSTKGRPKTAKRHHNSKKTYSSDDTDSDITDVSPISSPHIGSRNGYGRDLKADNHGSDHALYQAMPLEDGGRGIADGGDNVLNLSILMKAVSELEKRKIVKFDSRRVMFEPAHIRSSNKSNYTFSSDDAYRIEKENKRLLQQIMHQMHETENKWPSSKELRIKQSSLTASAVNRRRDQRKIESENLAILKRLQNIKPSKGISRNEQLSSYNSTVLHGIPVAAMHPSKGPCSGRESSASSKVGSLGRTHSLSSIHSSATASSYTRTTSRQSSLAGSRPASAKRSVRERPPWNDRW